MSTALASSRWTPDLAIVTGALDHVWQQLTPEHPRYPMFRWALMWQEEFPSGQHLTYWQTHLREWPRLAAKPSRTGLMARHAALWLRDGYSQSQIARALGYAPGNAPKTLWPRARDYLDWLRQQPLVRPGNLGGVEVLEEMYADGVDPASRVTTLDVDSPAPDAAEQARQWAGRNFWAPRVVASTEWSRFGWPESISTRLLYGKVELEAIERAEQELRAQQPYRAGAHADYLAA